MTWLLRRWGMVYEEPTVAVHEYTTGGRGANNSYANTASITSGPNRRPITNSASSIVTMATPSRFRCAAVVV